ncbi:Ribonuclease Z-like protein [Hapsidospora chrysogenum ATCC 11550]|uniref:ribonuclease Z n=1 Tax=Hapsidospora chrysogenum (strain ATCC 11550 / CBS 779.69 / DSM 880 / IAM 14645 / JCM 23072 / IMI 49137) TaxID=857340 RepID=A0A086THJ1_HAPC1|nr:Ribonuclease Z-like protein [Hapsidospora chrysogenum ATCC 11550]
MTSVVQLVTVPSADTPSTCLVLRTDKGHYIFGRIPEGTQRAFNSRRLSVVGVTQVFLSGSAGWDQLGGLTGYLLTIASAATAAKEALVAANADREKRGRKRIELTGHEGVSIHAGDNIGHILACNRGVIFRQPIRTHLFEHRDDPRTADPTQLQPDWQDDAVRVWKVPTTRERSGSPRKRRRSADQEQNDGDDAAAFKEEQSLSDPDVARIIVDHLLWNGNLYVGPLVMRRVGELQSTDTALVTVDGVLRKYTGPYADQGRTVPNPNDKAWVLPPPGSKGRKMGEETMRLEDIPLPQTSYSRTSMSYIVKTHDRRGKFDRAAAEALGVDKMDFKQLIAGREVKGKDGATVTPDMVLGDPIFGRGFIVADIAGPDFIESFMRRPEWSNQELMANIPVMYWLLGPGMSSHPRIQQFMREHPDTQHVICAPDTCPNMITNPGSAELQMMLRRIDPDRFPILKYDNAVKVPAPAADTNTQFGRAGRKVQLMPRLHFDDEAVAPFPDLVSPWDSVSPDVLALAEQAKAKASDPAFLAKIEQGEKDIPNRDASIVCLGTGSSVPSKYRNVSGTLIRVPGIGNYLFDCGEGTVGQIRRLYGDAETEDILRNLRCVVISHLHADHHLGAISVFRSWYEQTLRDGSTANLAVSCIPRFRDILQDLSQVEDFGFHRLRFPTCAPSNGDKNRSTEQHHRGIMTAYMNNNNNNNKDQGQGQGDDNFGLTAIRRVDVPHCYLAMGTELELTSGLRIAYSGDCRPSPAFARAFRGAHLLIHECTFADDMSDHARQKMHSTLSEALGVARDMGARRTLLTHFSQRYVKADSLRWDEDAHGSSGDGSGDGGGGGGIGGERAVLLAFDFMTVRLGDFQRAACYLPALEKLMEKTDE